MDKSHIMKLFKPRFESEFRKHPFSQEIIDDWNSLPPNIVISATLDILTGTGAHKGLRYLLSNTHKTT